jgi:hypothetical protein
MDLTVIPVGLELDDRSLREIADSKKSVTIGSLKEKKLDEQ